MLKVVSMQRCSVRFARWSIFGRGSKENSEIYEVPQESEEMADYQKRIEVLEAEVREEYIESRRNKSRLSASHRQQVQGRHPFEGVIFEYNNVHRSRKFKRAMLGRYGEKTGIDPGISWPTERDLKLAEEWENLYQPDTLVNQIAQVKQAEADLLQKQKDREAVLEAGLAKLDDQIAAWKVRQASKTQLLDKERVRREKVLAELRAEFGYDVNPEDESMAVRIADREKELAKAERLAKKQAREALDLEKKQKKEAAKS